jgi:hypothetical protein
MNIRRGAHAALDRDTLAKCGELKHSVDISIQLSALVWTLRLLRSVGISVVDLFRRTSGILRTCSGVRPLLHLPHKLVDETHVLDHDHP